MVEFIRCGFGTFDSAHAIGPANWLHHDLFFVHRGEVVLEFPRLDRAVTLARGSGILIWPQTQFRGRATGRRALASIQHFRVNPGSIAPFDRLLGQRNGLSLQLAPPSPWLELCVRQAQQVHLSPASKPDDELVRQLLLGLILMEGKYLDQGPRELPAKRIDLGWLGSWLRANLGSKPGIADLAQQAGLSPSRFRTVFLAEHGQTAGAFLLAAREAEGKRFLVETAEPLKGIAAALGYSDVVVFHRVFKRRTGLTPAVYRRQYRIQG